MMSVILSSTIKAQVGEYNPDYEWYTIKGKHVLVHYHEGAERTARTVAKIADEVWGPITSLYNYEPETVNFVIKDIDDYSNGATYFFDNKIEIWASALDFELRGTHNWLRNVISHEFTHMVQIQAAMKIGRTIPSFYLQFLNYEDKRRPDILYGFPNFIASYPLATINIPAWFAEGTAQYMRREFQYDMWDSHRDMILRSYALDNNMLTWNQMGVFEKTSLGNESVYNSGFALTLYISQKYGEDKLRQITDKLGKLTNFTIDAAFEDVLGKDGNQIYDEWSNFVKEDYRKRTKDVIDHQVTGKQIVKEGYGNFYPQFSNDGKKILYISNKNMDYLSLSSVYMYDVETGMDKQITGLIHSTVNFIPGTDKILYAKLSQDNPKSANIHDLYTYDLKTEDEKRITFALRANNPGISHDGKRIVFVFQKDGTSNLGLVDVDGKNFKRLTLYENGEQVYNPKFSPDDSYIIFDYSYHQTRDIAKIDTSGAGLEFVIKTDHDERNPSFGPDDDLYYASDITGIYNIYKMNLKTGKREQLTNVTGGAFMPDVDANGNVVYAGYTSAGYKLYYITKDEQAKTDSTDKYEWIANPPTGKRNPKGDMAKFDVKHLRDFDDYKLPDYPSEKYSGFLSKFSFYPFIRYDNYNTSNSFSDRIKPGVYLTSSDMLDKYSVFASASINKRMERDLYLDFEYSDKIPLLYNFGIKPKLGIELYSVSRKASTSFPFGVDSTYSPPLVDYNIPLDVTYDLFEFDFVASGHVFNRSNELETRFIFSQYVSTIGSFIFPESENTLYPTTTDKYLIGRNVQVKFTHDGTLPSIDSDINPTGRVITLQYNYEFNKFNNDNNYEVVDGVLKPLYNDYNFHRLELNWKEYFALGKGNTLTAQFRAGSILGPPVPDFFDFYLGGLVGMKSYPFYAVSGNEVGWLNLTYRFPLFKNIDTRFGQLYFDKIFFSVFGDLGNAWTGNFPSLSDFKKGAGAELRIKMNSFYLFPTSLFFTAAYSFDRFTNKILGEDVTYGKEWRFYGGILFDFSF